MPSLNTPKPAAAQIQVSTATPATTHSAAVARSCVIKHYRHVRSSLRSNTRLRALISFSKRRSPGVRSTEPELPKSSSGHGAQWRPSPVTGCSSPITPARTVLAARVNGFASCASLGNWTQKLHPSLGRQARARRVGQPSQLAGRCAAQHTLAQVTVTCDELRLILSRRSETRKNKRSYKQFRTELTRLKTKIRLHDSSTTD